MDTSIFDKNYFVSLVVSLLRHFLTAVGAWFTANNIGDEGQWNTLLFGLASLIVGLGLTAYNKYKVGLKIQTALDMPAHSSPEKLEKRLVEDSK